MSRANFKNTIEKEAKIKQTLRKKRKTYIKALLQEVCKVYLLDEKENIPEATKCVEQALSALKDLKS